MQCLRLRDTHSHMAVESLLQAAADSSQCQWLDAWEIKCNICLAKSALIHILLAWV